MAFFEWDVSSITSSKTTLYEGEAGGVFYGSLFGSAATKLWVRLPASAPAIGSIITSAATVGVNDGLYAIRGTCTGGTGHINGRSVMTGMQVADYQKGGRWIQIDRTVANLTKMSSGTAKKRLRLHYRSVDEILSPTA